MVSSKHGNHNLNGEYNKLPISFYATMIILIALMFVVVAIGELFR